MKELSLNILDIAQNSIKAGADTISIILTETESRFEIKITDNGCGMAPDPRASYSRSIIAGIFGRLLPFLRQ